MTQVLFRTACTPGLGVSSMTTPVSTGSWRAQTPQLQVRLSPSGLPHNIKSSHSRTQNSRSPCSEVSERRIPDDPGAQAAPSRGLSAHRPRGPRPPRPGVSARTLAHPSTSHHGSSRRVPPHQRIVPAQPRLHCLPATAGRSLAKSRGSSRDTARHASSGNSGSESLATLPGWSP